MTAHGEVVVDVTVRHHFNAGHRLHNPALGDDENRKLYGKCNNPSGHGHNYVVEVTLRGAMDPRIGAFVNADEVRSWLWNEVLDQIDHRNLNTDPTFMLGVIPTSENLACGIFRQLRAGPFGRWVHEVRLFESENNIATCRLEESGGGARRDTDSRRGA